jgi:hypothetical protein
VQQGDERVRDGRRRAILLISVISDEAATERPPSGHQADVSTRSIHTDN